MTPKTKAKWDYREGSNENPYPENSHEWEEYEIEYDRLAIAEMIQSERQENYLHAQRK